MGRGTIVWILAGIFSRVHLSGTQMDSRDRMLITALQRDGVNFLSLSVFSAALEIKDILEAAVKSVQ